MTDIRRARMRAGGIATIALVTLPVFAGCTPVESDDARTDEAASGRVLEFPLEAPEWELLETTVNSYPFGSDANADVSLNIEALGYTEAEYSVSGTARTYEAIPSTDFDVEVLGESNFVTRALVRQPADPDDWSGRVVVEYMNATDNMDLQIIWTRIHQQLISNGDAYIGFSGKSNVFPLLRNFDEDRYGELAFPASPDAEACGLEPGEKNYDPNLTSGDENGLLWDVWNGIGLSAKNGSGPLPGQATTVIAAGESQSAFGLINLYRWFGGDRATTADGTAIFDAYLDEDSVGWAIEDVSARENMLMPGRLNQCGDRLPVEDEQVSLARNPDRSVPYFAVHSQFGAWLPGENQSPNFRDWTITGANHVDRDMYSLIYPSEEDLMKAGIAGRDQLEWFAGAEVSWYSPQAWVCPNVPEAPLSIGVRSAYSHLLEWIDSGAEPPVTEPIKTDDEGAIVLDEHGNAAGGLRLPAIEAPVAMYVGGAWGDCSEFIQPFNPATLTQLYGTDAKYKEAYSGEIDTLVNQGLILPADGERLIAEVNQWQIVP